MNLKVKQAKSDYQNQLLSQITVLKQYSQALQLKNKMLTKEKQELQAQLRNVRLNFTATTSNGANIKSMPDQNIHQIENELREKYQRLLIDYNRLKNKARHTKINYDIYQKHNTNLSREKYKLQEKVTDLQTQVKAVKSMNTSLLSNNNQSFDKNYQQNLNTSMSYNQYESRHLSDKIQELQKIISMKNQQIAKYQAQIEQKNINFGNMKKDIENYYQKMTQLQNQLNDTKNQGSYKPYEASSQALQSLNAQVSVLKSEKLRLQQKNQLLQNRIQILQEANLNLTKQLRDRSYYTNITKLSQSMPTHDQSISSNVGYRLAKSVIPSYQNQYQTANNKEVPSYYLGEVQSRFITKKVVDNSTPIIVRQNTLYNPNNMSFLSKARYKSSISNDSRAYDSLQRKIENLAIQNNKLRKVLNNSNEVNQIL